MLLDVEVPVRVEAGDRQGMRNANAKWIGEKLGNQAHNVHAGITQREELVNAGTKEYKYLIHIISSEHWSSTSLRATKASL